MSIARILTAGLLFGLALFLFVGFLVADLSGSGPVVMVLTLLIAVILPAAGGVAVLLGGRRHTRAARAARDVQRRRVLEAELLRLAAAQAPAADGRRKLTAADVAGALAVEPELAAELLEDQHQRSLAEIELTEAGVVVYAFPELADQAAKDTARRALDV
ncbi:MAG: hypothetical protein AAGC60_25920 [Acidobacteriota bacterium]